MRMRSFLTPSLVLVWCTASALATGPVVWIEAESPDKSNFPHFEKSSMGKEALLSGGAWIMRGMNAADIAKLVPAEGIRLTYNVQAPAAGSYDLWARVGWYGARAEFRWRVGQGTWHTVSPDYPTINLMELGFFCEVSWAKLGKVDLPAGATTLEIHYPKATGAKARMLCALDCFAFLQGHFTPEGPFKPGQTYDQPADRKAAAHVFDLPAPTGPGRTKLALTGLWQVARYDDPDMDKDTYAPVRALPKPSQYNLRWMGLAVPASVWKVPPLVFGHRLIYRMRVRIPAEHKGRSMKLHFSGTNWIVSVFVDGKLAGTHQGVWVPWDLDITPHVKPGKTHEIAVAVKGTYYAMDGTSLGGDGSVNRHRNRPRSRSKWTRWVAPIYPSTKGDGDGYEYGIVNPVTLVSAGAVRTDDVFCKPSVRRKELGLELTLRNTSSKSRTVSVRCEAVHETSGKVEKAWALPDVTLAGGTSRTVSFAGAWANPKLWWPKPNPDMYRLRTTLREGETVVDVHAQPFGFREVTIDGPSIRLNGVRRNVWNWVDVSTRAIDRPEQWSHAWRAEGNRFMRFSHGRRITRALPTREQRLDYYDRAGVAGRLCTMIDGMFITFHLGERTREKGPGGESLLKPNKPVWASFRRHMAQVARAYRNHPSVIFYQVENELVYINGMNIYGGYLGQVESLMNEVCEAGRKIDPTRPYTVGGGGDLSGTLEINSPHYPHAAMDYYPDNAYTIEQYATKIQRWPWDRTKPWVVGESLFANELALGACVVGDRAFRGKTEALAGKAKFLRMIYGGYRWAGVAGFFPWDNLSRFEDGRKIFSDLYVCPRKQTSRLFAGKRNELLFKVLNDTLSAEPVTFEWSYTVRGKRLAGGKAELRIEPGFGQEQTLVINAPATDERLEGTLLLKASQEGAKTYVDERSIPVLPTGQPLRAKAKVYVLDRSGALTKHLKSAGLAAESVADLGAVKGKTGLLLIAHDTLTPAEAFGTGLLAFAAGGGRVVCLAQEHPPAGSALPAALRPTRRFGGYAHPQALATPIFADLGADDLIDWAGDHPTYKNVYQKPSSGGRSLAECGGALEYSPLVEMPCGRGLILLCQLRVAEKLGVDPAADVLLRNLIGRADAYRPAEGVVAIVAGEGSILADRAVATGVLSERVKTATDALNAARYKVAVIEASEANLQALLTARAKADAFQDAGGWIMLCGLEPAGLDAFNRLMHAEHMLRPFRIERVTLRGTGSPLAATLGNRDIALQSAKPLMHGRYWVSGHTFGYVIDHEDVAPFSRPPGAPDDPMAYKPTFDDHDPYNWCNGLLNDDSWRCIRQIWVDRKAEGGPVGLEHTFHLRRPETLRQINLWNNTNYSVIDKLKILFDGEEASAVTARLPESNVRTEVALPTPRKVAKTVTLRIESWNTPPHNNPKAPNLVGIDNVQFLRAEASKGVFLDSAGGLVAFPRGKGGVFLNQLKFLAEEPRPANDDHKRRVLGVLLQNMGAGFRSAAVVAVPGVNVRFSPVTIQEHCTAYLDDKSGKAGWFGRKGQDLESLPRGRGQFADVTFHVVDYATAPIPDCIILGGPKTHPSAIRSLPAKVTGIKVGRKADLLYFLHTAHVARPVTDRERSQMTNRRRPFVLPAVLTYVLHYADGKTAEIPVTLERHVNHWIQEKPMPLEGAQIGWSRPVPAIQDGRAVVYCMQAANPRPDVAVKSIDIVRPAGRDSTRATVAVLGVTLGEVVRTKP